MGQFVQKGSPPPKRRSRALRAVELVAWFFATISLGISLGMQAEAFLYQSTATPPSASSDVPSLTPGDDSVVSDASGVPDDPIKPGTPIARLVIPRLELDVVVAEGTSSRVLRRAVGRVARSAWPGEDGNIVLAGHRDTFFSSLAGIREGDLIVLDSGAGEQTYRVEWTRVVEPTDVRVLSQSSYPALTLITCYPFQYVGSAPRRFVVRARGHES